MKIILPSTKSKIGRKKLKISKDDLLILKEDSGWSDHTKDRIMKSFEQYISEKISNWQLGQVERFADKLFAHFDIDVQFTKHFKDRINDTRNNPPIKQKELMTFFQKAFDRYGDEISSMSAGKQAILIDLQKDLNLPFVFKWDGKNFEFDLVAKTIMRKHDFKSSDKKLRF